MKKFLIYPNEVKDYRNIHRAKGMRFWGVIEQANDGNELKLIIRPPYMARAINEDLQQKLMKLLTSNGFVLRHTSHNGRKDVERILKECEE